MPDPYLNARFDPTDSAIDQFAEQGLTLENAVYAIRNYRARTPAFKDTQHWYRGPTGDQEQRTIKVLVEERGATRIIIITVHTISS